MRPTFEFPVEGMEFGGLSDRVDEAYHAASLQVHAVRAGSHFLVSIVESERRLWSPWLHLDVRPGVTAESPDTIFGRFAPAPSVWTGVALAILAISSIGAGGAIFAYSQWIAGQRPLALWIVPLSLIALVCVVVAAKVGQSAGRDQMDQLTAPLAGEFHEWANTRSGASSRRPHQAAARAPS